MIPIFSLLQVLTAEEVDVTGVEGEEEGEVIVGAMEVEEDAEAVEVMEVEDAEVEGSDIFSGHISFFILLTIEIDVERNINKNSMATAQMTNTNAKVSLI